MKDALGDRMKRYEDASRIYLPPRLPIIVRLDGRAFHTFTKSCIKPFDMYLTATFDDITKVLYSTTMGCVLAYTQSDEINLCLQTDSNHNTESFAGGNLQKIVSLLASEATALFNHLWQVGIDLAKFDCRAFVMPWEDVPNYFLWRYKDWQRNSVSMLARSRMSHKECFDKKTNELRELCNWDSLDNRYKNGYWVPETLNNAVISYQEISCQLSKTKGEGG